MEFNIHGHGILSPEKRVEELRKAVFLENAFKKHNLTDPYRELNDMQKHDALQTEYRSEFPHDIRHFKQVLDLHARRRSLPTLEDTIHFDEPEGGS